LSLIADLCGFQRQVWAKNAALKEQLDSAVKRIGTDAVEGKDPETRIDNDMKSLRKQLSNAKRDLALAEEKIDGLQRQLILVNSELKRADEEKEEASESLDYMISTGRRFTL
jgi:chromosome segregation ATPase